LTIYNFDQTIQRRSSGSAKWQFYDEDVIPLWVADMDFESPREVIEALQARAAHGVFGYELPSKELGDVICARLEKTYQWKVLPDELVYLPGLVTGINVAVRAACNAGDAMITQTPVYYPFLDAPKNFGAVLQEVELTRRDDGSIIRYETDFEKFEESITPQTKLFMLCNPHNPGGFSYRREQLARLGEICLKHNVVVCSDEIHCDLLLEGQRHTPLASLAPELAANCITLMAPSKTFNVAGLGCSYAVIQNEELRRKFKAAAEGVVPLINVFGLTAALAAYQHGDEWLSQVLPYLRANRDTLVEYVRKNLLQIRLTNPEATYLAWLDCREAGIDGNPQKFFLEKARVAFSDGATFGKGGEGFVRLNFGCTRATLQEALGRMKRWLGG
jgi:cystathionine beta-lyase